MNKYHIRAIPSIQKNESVEDSTWYNQFLTNLKEAVTTQHSIYHDISAIIDNAKPKFSSVEEAVKDLKERTGLTTFMDAKKAIAFIQQEPKIFQTIPELKIFIDNFIEDHPGTSVASVVHDLLSGSIRNKLPQSDVDDDVKAYINAKIGEIKAQKTDHNEVNHDIGKVTHDSNIVTIDDPFAICEPHVIK